MFRAIKKSKLNLIIDIIMFLVMFALAGIGFLIKYLLIPGFKRGDIYGKDVELFFLGLDRHQWGDIHLYVAYLLAFLLVLHLYFHWKQVVHIYRGMFKTMLIRVVVFLLIVGLCAAVVLIPFVVNPKIVEGVGHHQHEVRTEMHEQNASEINSIEVYGYQTLEEVAIAYDLDLLDLADKMKLSNDDVHEKLGRLKRRGGINFDDLKGYIIHHKK